MASTSTIILFGILFARLQLAAGILLGRCLPRAVGRSRAESLDAGYLDKLARRLHELVVGLSGEVDQHQTRQLQDQLLLAQEQLDEQARQIQSSVNLARTDPLTGLANRRAFDDELVRRITDWHRCHAGFCLVMIDVDHFKALNDRYGHLSGDQVLRGLGELFAGLSRPADLPARLGGEEFAVLLSAASCAQAGQIAEEILAAVASRPFPVEEATIHITVSLGLSMVQPGDGPLTLLRRADDALVCLKARRPQLRPLPQRRNVRADPCRPNARGRRPGGARPRKPQPAGLRRSRIALPGGRPASPAHGVRS